MPSPLNYNQLFYFWVVAQEGNITSAAKRLHLSQPAISSQLKRLEESLGEPLLAPSGRHRVLTPFGRTTYEYAERIFALGQELKRVAEGHDLPSSLHLTIGVGDTLPKVLVAKLLAPVFRLVPSVNVSIRQDRWERLIGALAAHELELVLGDHPVQSHSDVKARSVIVAESAIVFYASQKVAAPLRRKFPRSLQQVPCILPPRETALRRAVERWIEEQGIRVQCVAEVDDSALTKALGHWGIGVFPAPASIEDDLADRYGVRRIGEAQGLVERVYAISRPQRREHPGIAALLDGASSLRAAGPSSTGSGRGSKHNF
jgi:LysR family transcriptional activator of nhaA